MMNGIFGERQVFRRPAGADGVLWGLSVPVVATTGSFRHSPLGFGNFRGQSAHGNIFELSEWVRISAIHGADIGRR